MELCRSAFKSLISLVLSKGCYAKSDKGFVASVVGSGVGVDNSGGGVKDCIDCGMFVVYTGGNEYDKSGQNQSKTDKTRHGNEKSLRNRS
nr:hypothetical protein [Tanacetum cinerariifolium]